MPYRPRKQRSNGAIDMFDSLERAKASLERDAREKGGTTCPCCRQHAQVYVRRLNTTQARILLALLVASRGKPEGWAHVREVKVGNTDARTYGGDMGKLALHGLVEAKPREDEDTGRTSGVWRITPLGHRFARGVVAIPAFVEVYNGKVVGKATETIAIHKALAKGGFRWEDLMGEQPAKQEA